MRRLERTAAQLIMSSARSSSTASSSVDSAYFALPESSSVVLSTVQSVGHIVLNRPKALNALNLDMIRTIFPTLKVGTICVALGLICVCGRSGCIRLRFQLL
jgi:hypothetical protein